jgi:hypothetical protein
MCLMALSVQSFSSMHLIRDHFPMCWQLRFLQTPPHCSMNNFCACLNCTSTGIWFSHIINFFKHVIPLHYGIVIGNFLHTTDMMKLMLHCFHTNTAYHRHFLLATVHSATSLDVSQPASIVQQTPMCN